MEVNYTDEEISLLVIKAQGRDQKAFEALYEQYRMRVSSRVYAILRQVESMQDITHEIWLAVFLALPTLKNPAAFPGWLMRIAIHKAWKVVQQHVLQTISLDTQDEEAFFLIEDEDLVETVLRNEQRNQLYSMFAQLTDKEREVLIPFYMEEISLAEIATRLNLSLSAVKSRLYQARKRLHLILLKGECFL
jgi:RNA polymerase sigma factor (sigma-70 family)